MKIVIDIPDEAYELLKSKSELDNIAESIIANGTPYEERPHGEWIEKVETKQVGYGWLTSHEFVCSVCDGSGEDDEGIPQNWNYCPNCGAKMDGKEAEE